jgi:primosomal protein N' (replication factor Y)
LPEKCLDCGSVELARIGAGTQRLETELERKVPGLERIRLDADTASRPGAFREALERFAEARAAALIGTQMVAKGHHFPGVSIAAVVDADAGLSFPDFRSEERTFQLVTQLAGRAGRDAPGKVIVQTFQPDAVPFTYAMRHDVAGFLARELSVARSSITCHFTILLPVVSGPDQRTRSVRLRSCAPSWTAGREAAGTGALLSCAGAIALSCWRKRPLRERSRRSCGALAAAALRDAPRRFRRRGR